MVDQQRTYEGNITKILTEVKEFLKADAAFIGSTKRKNFRVLYGLGLPIETPYISGKVDDHVFAKIQKKSNLPPPYFISDFEFSEFKDNKNIKKFGIKSMFWTPIDSSLYLFSMWKDIIPLRRVEDKGLLIHLDKKAQLIKKCNKMVKTGELAYKKNHLYDLLHK